jgi:hypothetical protein
MNNMGIGLDGEPNTYTAGNDFDYSVWTAGTQVDLVNVNWNNDYKDVVKFESKNALNTYINSLQSAGIRLNNLTYAKPDQDILLPIPYNRVNRYNYLRASNPLMPIPNDIQKDFYYFILACEYVNPQVTRIRVQLDVWQTYVYDVSIGNCYVERGHIGIANENAFNNYGRDYLTVPEGIDLGADYRVISKRTEEIVSLTAGSLEYEHDIIVVSTTDLTADPGTEDAPSLKTPQPSTIQSMPSAAAFYVFETVGDFSSWLNTMNDYPWVTQGIISVTIMPKISRYNLDFVYDGDPEPQHVSINANPIKHNLFTNWRESSEILNWLPVEYRHLTKFLTSPYMMIEMTSWSATPVILRPEAWNEPNAQIMERINYMPPNQRVQFIPRKYNSSGQTPDAFWGMTYDELSDLIDSLEPYPPGFDPVAFMARFGDIGDDFGDYLDVLTQIASFPSLPVVNNMALSYIASNSQSIAYQRQSAEWTQTRALGMAQGQYDLAGRAQESNQRLTDIGKDVALAQTASQNTNLMMQTLVGGIGGVVGGAGAGAVFGPVGAGAGAASGAAQALTSFMSADLQALQNDAATGIRNTGAQQTTWAQNLHTEQIRNTNMRLADFAAKGDYANAIAGVNARVQDAAMIQPSISGQFGGDAANIANGTMELSVRWKLIDLAAIRIIGDYWLRFGYAIRAFIQPPQSLMVMSKFTYWKMTEAYIVGATVPEGHKQVIRGIMEKGFTVFASPDDIGTVNIADNAPLSGVSY